ncbi:NUDIX hydrolase [Conexibacter sp. JD483]|uniref:NUDIX hydrolase n=1 Tax=unclassified Conexibacter TaxID=2627773 RepID=UPI002718138B|nr:MULTISPECIES: NUDIX hydrolase [unclassified Conexibacter]MDO8186233.1 NUDIX hydrolase [Conexibacter sp. CPCC 205706]MDO8199700.1 NUDIX hydrolase [Conexibacter sp. CPCC 205762]MDR9368208.1 NUDIX hydrolase [Conexibacter sp. JD483]
MALTHDMLARGPWSPDQVTCAWREDTFVPAAADTAAADAALAKLRERGSPSHDGLAARLSAFEQRDGGLQLELQPARWSLRLTGSLATRSVSVLCVVRDADGRWLAGRRAAWVASWTGRWTLGAGGAVEVGECPVDAMTRELEEEWSVVPERLTVEALAATPNGLAFLVGLAWLPAGAVAVPDDEHDAHAWWPAEIDRWPAEADETVRRMAALLA